MEAAAKKVQLLVKRELPQRPHHLAKHLDRRCRVPADHERRFEEREFRELQYMTLLSDADRGLLLTRPYYDMREEPPNPSAAREAIAKTERKPVTKLSLSDYKNKQKKTTSASPPDSGPPAPKPSALRNEVAEAKSDKTAIKTEDNNERGSDATASSKTTRPREDEKPTKLDPKTKSSQDTSDTPEKRKRAKEDDALRPQKKAKPEPGTPQDERERARTPRDDTPRKKDANPNASSSRERAPQKEAKHSAASSSASSSSMPNGKTSSKTTMSSQSNLAPHRARGNSVNGARPEPSTSTKNTSSKEHGAAARTTLPPLLSPLHFAIGDGESQLREDRGRYEEDEPPPKAQKSARPAATASVAATKKEKSPVKLPPLLSPTLPPQLEEELARIGEFSQKDFTRASQTAQSSEPPKKSRPIKKEDSDEEEEEDRRSVMKARDKQREREKERDRVRERERERDRGRDGEKEHPARFMVTLKVSKQNRKALKRLLALPPRTSKERSASLEAPPASSAAARKRPLSGTDGGEPVASKRPRTSDMSAPLKAPAPSTPAAKSMSRVASNTSQANTPGDANTLTPSDRAPTALATVRQESADPARVRSLRDLHRRFHDLGGKLKHKRDALLSPSKPGGGGGGERGPSKADQKLGIALCLESAMAYMLAFRAVFESRRLESKAQDPKAWDQILPMLDGLRRDVGDGKHLALEALYQQLKGVILEELVKCYWSLDPAVTETARAVWHYERLRSSVWKAAGESADRVDEVRMKAGFGPWTGVEHAVQVGLKIVRRWAADEDVNWAAEVSVSTANGA